MSALLKQLVGPLFNSVASSYRGTVGLKLAKYGLRFDDLHDPLKDEDVAEALRRLPPDVVVARNCRLRRALDLSSKHEGLPKDLLAKQTPELSYLTEALEEVRAERRERAQLGTPAPYTRIYH
ncbi:Cytochrome b-c1 complex subunit 7-2 [Tetrabaena socialis]|uniref:Complex III subunit VII n=1 Tax=Tetrabaena socialis TaxID=47790 RepID=A0A2J7ZS29_9CHLO|nr:Cytochrome b-c1 complex subunit 7-2 [Tetrabaena socialis]|eukprot:PNH03079.1 Cytochrome b-c1 complex subunit 7-2 [Tetrabaena socialis]